VIDGGMVTNANIRTAQEALAYLCNQQLLQPLDEDTFTLAAPIRARLERMGSSGQHPEPDQRGEETIDPASTRQVPVKYPASALQVAKALQEQEAEMSRAQLQQTLELSDREHFSKEYLQPALASGLVEMTIPDKPRSSKQQYRLTEIGRSVLENRE
jgi:ATP-dependent DNA helicase RecG